MISVSAEIMQALQYAAHNDGMSNFHPKYKPNRIYPEWAGAFGRQFDILFPEMRRLGLSEFCPIIGTDRITARGREIVEALK